MIKDYHIAEAERYTRVMVAKAVEAIYPAEQRELALKRSCLLHSLYLCAALKRAGYQAMIQAGSAFWRVIPDAEDDGVRPLQYGYEFEHNADSVASIRSGVMPEMHCWVGVPNLGMIIDLTTKYIPDLVALAGMECRIPQPDSLWLDVTKWPDGVHYDAKVEACAGAIVLTAWLTHKLACPILKSVYADHRKGMR